ncbi:MAG: DUF1858 domain-containing protein [Methanomicrobium sp.]|uniref:DUF1858 domain-containing protein n=1 Tax=Methanomicrobium mobile TaxID=2205 RepID=UPI0005B28446|nr:DUF1858 domain-containing protein [Methanomicrobium mobile]MBO7388318.1 DUF1858 domain-containing protein [Methanomicrobium sp.]MBQ3718583.1 DUF1858 domain-containing protein [Methanomicrobium sp.]MBQ4414592.1 DUF1858 domain-containing protein [Methanomicrobium sp.]
MTLTADSPLSELLQENPRSAEILMRFGMGCVGCALASGETIRQAAAGHGIPLDELLDALGIKQ